MADPIPYVLPDVDAEPLVPLAIWPCADPNQPTAEAGLVTPALARRLVVTYTQPGEVVWDLTGGMVHTAAQALDRCATEQPSRPVRLAVTLQPAPDPVWTARCDWSQMLAPGGLLAVCTRGRPDPQQPTDPLGAAITAAQRAGLSYLQHVIALTVPIRQGQLAALRTAQEPPQATGLPAHLVVHTDVLVFAAAGSPSDPSPARTFGLAGAGR